MPELPALPAWAETIRRKYLGNEASVFILHLNVFDAFLHQDQLCDLESFLCKVLLGGNKQSIIVFDPASGVRVLAQQGTLPGSQRWDTARSPAEVLPLLEEVLLATDSTAVVIPYAATVAPAGPSYLLSEQDRINVVRLHRWSLGAQMAVKDNVVFLVTELLSELSGMLVSNPKIAAVEIPMPSLAERQAVIGKVDPSLSTQQTEILAHHAAGLKVVQIQSLLTPHPAASDEDRRRSAFVRELLGTSAESETRAAKLAALTRGMSYEELRDLTEADGEQTVGDGPPTEVIRLIQRRKREIIEKECQGLIEFVHGRVDFAHVGGCEQIKTDLLRIAASMRAGERAKVPMGLLFVGPMGTGKTFLASAFARSTGLSAVKLMGFRSKWVGATEANLERVLTMVRALGPTILIIDEGERALSGGGEGDGGTSSRVIARLKEFMSEPDNRGNVLVILMTNRPDKLDVDIKRAGRLDRKIPFFFAAEAQEIEQVIAAVVQRHSLPSALGWPQDRLTTSERLLGYSNAEIEAVVLLAHELAECQGGRLNAAVLGQAIDDYLPARDTAMLEYMELLAVAEASRRSMLPTKYRSLGREELGERIQRLRLRLR